MLLSKRNFSPDLIYDVVYEDKKFFEPKELPIQSIEQRIRLVNYLDGL
jgi:hypothetical protein